MSENSTKNKTTMALVQSTYSRASPGRSGSARFMRLFSFDSLPMICLMPAGQDRPAFDKNYIS